MLLVLTQLKELELMNEQENESDEYRKRESNFAVDAFVALGGQPTKEGYISKNTLIEIIKTEFELTIDMEVLFALSFEGLPAEDRRRHRQRKLLPVLRSAGRGHQREPQPRE